MPTIAERVAAGAEWLDSHVPNWRDKVGVSWLDMSSTRDCVLGQVFAEEVDETSYIFSGYVYGENCLVADDLDPGALGFETTLNPADTSKEEEFNALRNEWIRVISEG